MKKKYILIMLLIPLLMVGCKKEENKEKVISESVKMFTEITPNTSFDDVVEIMQKAEKEGFGTFNDTARGSMRNGDKAELTFDFKVTNKEAEKSHETDERLYEVSGAKQQMYENGQPVVKSNYYGATVAVTYRYEDYKKKIICVRYEAESDNEKIKSMEYSFVSECIVNDMGIENSSKLQELQEKGSKKEVDKFLIELTN
ncbi:MAG: hypothetical protein E6649_16060 [Paeniclostridium sordellii]|nr:hypothetical protein [Paeniclostridium sordellii]